MLLSSDAQGSPPLARGTVCPLRFVVISCGITPARAGNRGGRAIIKLIIEDHPRSRGEQRLCPRRSCHRWGSPPLARGTVRPAARVADIIRITPARAGNRWPDNTRDYRDADHPRSRGEQDQIIFTKLDRWGSPPLARGTAHRRRKYYGCNRDHPRSRGEQVWFIFSQWMILGSPPLARGTAMP